MNNNVLIVNGSPRGKKGNSESLSDYLQKKLNERSCQVNSVLLRKEMSSPDELLSRIKNTDVLVLSFPVYENSVPGLVLEFFEWLTENRELLATGNRKLLVISNSGFPEPEAHESAIAHCKAFTCEAGFAWLGGIPVAPGTLIDGKKLEETGGTYRSIRSILDLTAEMICRGEAVPEERIKSVSRPLFSPIIYRLAGRFLQNGAIKKMGRQKYFARPLIE